MIYNMYSTVAGVLLVASSAWAKIPTYVMLPLDTITSDMQIKDSSKLNSYFQQLKSAGTEGVMSDCWWGLVEQKESQYNFSPYLQLTQMAQDAGLKMQYVLSFHQCGAPFIYCSNTN
jgi:beta-amylase